MALVVVLVSTGLEGRHDPGLEDRRIVVQPGTHAGCQGMS